MCEMEFVSVWTNKREGQSGNETEGRDLMIEMGFKNSLDSCDAIGGKVLIDGEKVESEIDEFVGGDGEVGSIREVCVQEIDILRGGL